MGQRTRLGTLRTGTQAFLNISRLRNFMLRLPGKHGITVSGTRRRFLHQESGDEPAPTCLTGKVVVLVSGTMRPTGNR
jgi:hypothetical protein